MGSPHCDWLAIEFSQLISMLTVTSPAIKVNQPALWVFIMLQEVCRLQRNNWWIYCDTAALRLTLIQKTLTLSRSDDVAQSLKLPNWLHIQAVVWFPPSMSPLPPWLPLLIVAVRQRGDWGSGIDAVRWVSRRYPHRSDVFCPPRCIMHQLFLLSAL